MPEERPFEVGLLAYAVYAQHHGALRGLLERETGIRAEYGGAEVHGNGDNLIGLVAFEHRVQEPTLLKVFTGQPEVLELFPVDHRFVESVLGLTVLWGLRLGGLFLLCHFFVILIVDTLSFAFRRDVVLREELRHSVGLLSCGEVFDGLSDFRVIERLLLDGEDTEPGRVFQLAPEVLDETLEHVRVAVKFEERVAVFLFGGYGFIPAVLVEFGDCLQEQFHFVKNEDDVAELLVLNDRRALLRGVAPDVFCCHKRMF